LRFNGGLTGTNSEFGQGKGSPTPAPAATRFSVVEQGPILTALEAVHAEGPLAKTRITLFSGLDRIEIANTPDRSRMPRADVATNSRYFAFTFPLALQRPTARFETAAGWLDPGADTIEGAFRGAHVPQHVIDLSEGDYGVAFASPDVYSHSFGGFPGAAASFPPENPTIVSTYIRYADEAILKGNTTGTVTVEPGAPAQWDVRYALRPHARAFDPVADARFGWEVSTPLLAAVAPAGQGILTEPSRSFFSVDAPNVLITALQRADFGEGLIVQLQEIARKEARVTLRSEVFPVVAAWETTPVQDDLQPLRVCDDRALTLHMRPAQIRTLRQVVGE
jgi:hypothetical protein